MVAVTVDSYAIICLVGVFVVLRHARARSRPSCRPPRVGISISPRTAPKLFTAELSKVASSGKRLSPGESHPLELTSNARIDSLASSTVLSTYLSADQRDPSWSHRFPEISFPSLRSRSLSVPDISLLAGPRVGLHDTDNALEERALLEDHHFHPVIPPSSSSFKTLHSDGSKSMENKQSPTTCVAEGAYDFVEPIHSRSKTMF
ncbi:hypothetical protein PM082_008303 [Marasmius tenuissimus]|nr:hypothetical protein PM082_008303 [Marasmius tenuissimus]